MPTTAESMEKLEKLRGKQASDKVNELFGRLVPELIADLEGEKCRPSMGTRELRQESSSTP
jgi:hypothetical protein